MMLCRMDFIVGPLEEEFAKPFVDFVEQHKAAGPFTAANIGDHFRSCTRFIARSDSCSGMARILTIEPFS